MTFNAVYEHSNITVLFCVLYHGRPILKETACELKVDKETHYGYTEMRCLVISFQVS